MQHTQLASNASLYGHQQPRYGIKLKDAPNALLAQQQQATACCYQQQSQSTSVQLASSQVVMVWDLDETLIIFKSLLDGSYASEVNTAVQDMPCTATSNSGLTAVSPKASKALGERVADNVFDFLDNHLLYSHVSLLGHHATLTCAHVTLMCAALHVQSSHHLS